MNLKMQFYVFGLVLCFTLSYVSALRCYVCSSMFDDNCGKTWGYGLDGGEGENYLQTCIGESVACQKLEYDGGQSGLLVTRDCWNASRIAGRLPKMGCQDMSNGKVCYCGANEHEDTCNGKQLLQPHIAAILTGLLLFLLNKF